MRTSLVQGPYRATARPALRPRSSTRFELSCTPREISRPEHEHANARETVLYAPNTPAPGECRIAGLFLPLRGSRVDWQGALPCSPARQRTPSAGPRTRAWAQHSAKRARLRVQLGPLE